VESLSLSESNDLFCVNTIFLKLCHPEIILDIAFDMALAAISVTPLATTITPDVVPGDNLRTTGYAFSSGIASFTCDCDLYALGDTIRVFLDTFNTTRND